jgi:hypothetical protein
MTETEARWAERVAAWKASGKRADEFAQGQPFKASTLKLWHYEFRKRASSSKVPNTTSVSPATAAPPVVVPMARVVSIAREQDASIVVDVGGARVIVGRGFDVELLCEVVRALRGAP